MPENLIKQQLVTLKDLNSPLSNSSRQVEYFYLGDSPKPSRIPLTARKPIAPVSSRQPPLSARPSTASSWNGVRSSRSVSDPCLIESRYPPGRKNLEISQRLKPLELGHQLMRQENQALTAATAAVNAAKTMLEAERMQGAASRRELVACRSKLSSALQSAEASEKRFREAMAIVTDLQRRCDALNSENRKLLAVCERQMNVIKGIQ